MKVAVQPLLAEEENLKAMVAGYDQAEKGSVTRKERLEQKVESKFEWELADIQNKPFLQVPPLLVPLAGYVLKLRRFQRGQIISAGQPLLELVPTSADRAVEVKVDDNDAPLVASRASGDEPRTVRLQFEEW